MQYMSILVLSCLHCHIYIHIYELNFITFETRLIISFKVVICF